MINTSKDIQTVNDLSAAVKSIMTSLRSNVLLAQLFWTTKEACPRWLDNLDYSKENMEFLVMRPESSDDST